MRIHTRHRRRAILIPTALITCLSVSLSACSGDSDSDDPSGSSTSDGSGDNGSGASDGASDGQSQASDGDTSAKEPKAPQLRECTVTVDASGDVETSWEGDGEVRIRSDNGDFGKTARYSATDGKSRVTVYSPDPDIPYPAATFSQGDQGFTSDEDSASNIQVKGSGAGAQADLTMGGLGGASLDIKIDFSCDKAGKKKSRKKSGKKN